MPDPRSNLNTFRILFIVKAVLTFLFSLFFLFYMSMGSIFGSMASMDPNADLDFNPGWIFVIIGGIGLIFCLAMGILALVAAKRIKEERSRTFIIVVAAIHALTGILGILLAVFTIIELTKPEVKALFDGDEMGHDIIDSPYTN